MRLSFALHILGVVLWVGGLLFLSRLMVLHTKEDPSVRPRYSFLERKFNLFALIGAPLVLLTGLYQLSLWPHGAFRTARWMHHKLSLVILMFIIHVLLTVRQRQWERGPADARLSRALPVAAHSLVGLALIGVLALVYLAR